MAGGFGKRLSPLTLKTPKPAIIVRGKPIIRHVLDWLEDVGFDDIIVKLHYLPELIQQAVGNDINVHYVIDQKLKPTAKFLLDNKNYLEDQFLVTNGDTLTNLNLLEFIEFHMIHNNLATVFTKDDAIHTGGTYIFEKEILDYIKPDMDISHLIAVLIEANIPINLFFSDARYFDIATLEKLEKARKYFQK